ncbi:MAG: lysine--tRNA ligase, partial [Lentisphaeria bacterium]|nr:lysine--tRNA ligase [Lentisphaeria bacterium]
MSQNGEQAPEQPQSPSDVFKQRTTKLAALKEAGINAYGGRVDDVVSTTEARSAFEKAAEDEEVRVVLAGRLMAKRIMGKSIFADIKDENGRLQLYVQKKVLEDQFQIFKSLDLGDILTATGTIFVTRMGEVSLRVEQFRILSKSLRALPEKWHGLTNVEQRYRQRYLDLIVNDDVRETFRTRSRIVASIRSYMADQGFMEVETPMMQPLAGGAAARPFKTHYNALGCPMYMRIAPELYLKRLLVGGFEKVFELNRNFRNEGLSRRHNPEFTMIEAYQAYSDCQGMMELVEGMITTAARDVLGTLILEKEGRETLDLTPPWRRVTYAELIRETMGEDWYDLPTDKKREKAR